MGLTSDQTQEVYEWVDKIPLSRPKRNITRDFSDAVLCAEIVQCFVPKLVDIHNYPPANGISQKIYNWNTFNQKVLKKLDLSLTEDTILALSQAKSGIIEELLYQLKRKIESLKPQTPTSIANNPNITQFTALNQLLATNPQLLAQLLQVNPGLPPLTNQPHMQYPQMQPTTFIEPLAPLSKKSPTKSSAVTPRNQIVPSTQPTRDQRTPNTKIRDLENEKSTLELQLQEKSKEVQDLKETMQIMHLKIQKLEQLLDLKDRKIAELSNY